jgi:hypothetical protein
VFHWGKSGVGTVGKLEIGGGDGRALPLKSKLIVASIIVHSSYGVYNPYLSVCKRERERERESRQMSRTKEAGFNPVMLIGQNVLDNAICSTMYSIEKLEIISAALLITEMLFASG